MSTATATNVATQTRVVQARHVSKVFKRDAFEVKSLDDVSIEISGGEFLALMGPSGSGKTTLLNMIGAIDRPTKGELLVLGENVFRFNDKQSANWRNAHIGYVFQTFNLIPVLTAFENVELPLLLTKLNAQQRRDHVMTALKLVGLEDRVHHLPKQLSGGQEQRVAIARAIVSDPTLLLADEPTGDLTSFWSTRWEEKMDQPTSNLGSVSQPDQQHSGAQELLQLVSFKIGNEEFGLDILRVQEIIRVQELTRVPNSPDFMDGVINLRGKVIPIIALRKRFGLEQQ